MALGAEWKSTLQHRSPEEYRAALRAEYARLRELRDEELAQQAAVVGRLAQHDEHGAPAHGARPGGWKMWHSNDVPDEPASGMTAAEKFMFDLSGWFVRPSILTPEEVAAVREQVYLITHDREALPPHERRVPGGAASILIDHPKVVEVLEELYGGPDSVRLEIAMAFWRERGEREGAGADGLSQGWHQGGPELATSPVFGYQYKNGKIYPGMVRVIFELGDVSQNDGATHFIVGSHKANFTMNPAFLRESEEAILDLSANHSPLIAGYDCPAGSAIFFTENLCHVGPPWQADHPRVSVLHAYSHLATNFRNLQARLDPETLAGLPLEKLAYFRPPFTSEPHSLQRFLENPDMSWGHEGVGKPSSSDSEGKGTAAELLSIEAMVKRGFLTEAEAEAAKHKVLAVAIDGGSPKL